MSLRFSNQQPCELYRYVIRTTVSRKLFLGAGDFAMNIFTTGNGVGSQKFFCGNKIATDK